MRPVTSLALGMLALAILGCPMPPPKPVASTVAGVWHARVPAADATARVVTLWLQPGGAAALETVYIGKGRMPVENGVWSVDGDAVTIRLDGQREPLVYGIATDRLVPRRWDQNLYGATGLPLTRRASYDPERPSVFETNVPPPDAERP